MAERADGNRRGMILPVVLIVLGVLFLLDNVGPWRLDVWKFVATLWPVLFIAVGVDLLLGGRKRGLVVAGALVAGALLWFGWGTPAGGETVRGQEISQPLEGVDRAEIHLSPGIARLEIRGMPGRGELLSGTVSTARGTVLDESFVVRGDTAVYRLAARSRSGFAWPFGGDARRRWELALSRQVPVDLRVDAGVGELTLDLAELDLAALRLDTGVGEVAVTLPEGTYPASIDTGVGEVTVRLPAGAAARIQVESGIGDVNVRGDFVSAGDHFVSPDFEEAQHRIDLRISGGVGEIDVETY